MEEKRGTAKGIPQLILAGASMDDIFVIVLFSAFTAMAAVIKLKSSKGVSARLSAKFGKLWIASELILFTLVGTAVDISYTLKAGPLVLVMLCISLIFRACGVFTCLLGTKLSKKERLFCVMAYIPKATVQASIGSVPLALRLACGNTVLSAAIVAILFTAPSAWTWRPTDFWRKTNKTKNGGYPPFFNMLFFLHPKNTSEYIERSRDSQGHLDVYGLSRVLSTHIHKMNGRHQTKKTAPCLALAEKKSPKP